MTKRRLRIPDETVELVRALHPELRRKVRAALEAILNEPELGDPLRGELAGLLRVRVGRLRIVHRIESRTIAVVAIGPRETIYVELAAQRRRAGGRGSRGRR